MLATDKEGRGKSRRKAVVRGERHVVALLFQQLQSRLVSGERGASLVEYALLIALIGLVCVGALQLLGNDVSTPLSGIGSSLSTGS